MRRQSQAEITKRARRLASAWHVTAILKEGYL